MRMTEEQLRNAQDRIMAGASIRTNTCMDAPQGKKVKDKRPAESIVLRQCITILDTHPAVALSWRFQVGVMKMGGHFNKFGFRGGSDLMGVLKAGARFLAVECKGEGGRLTKEQDAFLKAVNAAGGLGLMVDDPEQLVIALRGLKR